MNGLDVLASLRDDLAQELQSYIAPVLEPLAMSPWLAMSLLQKAIRRGKEQFALQAGASLLQEAPDRLWRRLSIIAFEDVGAADLDAIGLVIASLAGKAFRGRLGGEWAVASYLIRRLVHAPKCRAADDLLMIAERHPSLERTRLSLTFQTTPGLIHIATSSSPLPERALALWFGIGTDRCPSTHLRTRKGNPDAVFDGLCEASFPHSVVEIAREGFRKIGMICPFLPLLIPLRPGEPMSVADDDFPPEVMCGALPSWAIDMFSRQGRKALAQFLDRDCPTARWVRRHIPPAQQVDCLGYILFAIESGLLKKRYRWPVAQELRRLAEVESQGPHCPDAIEIMSLMRGDIDILNEVRRHVV